MSFNIDSIIFYRREMALKSGLFVIVNLLLLYLSNSILQNKMLSILFLIFAVLPIIFLKEVTKRYSYNANFILDDQRFLVIVHKNKSDITFNYEYNLNDIESYSIQFPTRKLFAIRLNFKNGNSKEYSIFKDIGDKNMEKSLISAFHSMIQVYNNHISDSLKIHFCPSFYASFYGLLCIVAYFLLLVVLITLQIIFVLGFLPITIFFGSLLLLQIIIRRKSDIDYYNKIVTSDI